MRRFAAVAAFGALLCAAPAQAELLVSISKSQQRLSVSVNGEEAYRWPVSTGRKGYTTPSGIFRPTRLERHWYSRKYDMAPMPYSVFFHRGYAVHGTTEAANLGRPASHGCVRLRPDNASILFSMVRRYGAKHTKVVVMDGPLPRGLGHQPMAEVPAVLQLAKTTAAKDHGTQANAKAEAKGHSESLSAKTHVAATHEADAAPVVKRSLRTRVDSVERVSMSVGDEAQVLREREAWLRAIDRKYGIAR
jgi:hypothetical protein